MRRIFLAALLLLVVFPLAAAVQVQAQPQGKAVILSSMNQVAPIGPYYAWWSYYLTQSGYQVTFLADRAVTLDFLTTQLNNYDIVIWRTNLYTYRHVVYWYVGQIANSATLNKYAADFARGWVNFNAGVLGISTDFFNEHFTPGSLSKVKLTILISSNSVTIANYFMNAGVKAAVSVNGLISLTFGLIDNQTGALLAYLSMGQTVLDAVYNVVNPYAKTTYRDPLDSYYKAPFWFSGNGALTITH